MGMTVPSAGGGGGAGQGDLRHPWSFPFPTSGTDKMLAPQQNITGDMTAGARKTVFQRSGSGLIRNLSWIASAANNAFVGIYNAATIEIFYDGHLPGAADISLPMKVLACMEHPRSSFTDCRFDSEAIAVTEVPNTSIFPGQITATSGNLKLPIPYTNGIRIDVVVPNTTDHYNFFFNVAVQEPLPSSWNSGLRLFAVRSAQTIAPAASFGVNYKLTDATHLQVTTGTLPVGIAGGSIIDGVFSNDDILVITRTDATHAVVSSKDTYNSPINVVQSGGGNGAIYVNGSQVHTFLTRPAGKNGYIALVVGGSSVDQPDIDALFEPNIRVWLSGTVGTAEPDMEWTSVEDFAMGSFDFEQPNRAWGGGCLEHSTTNNELTIYKDFTRIPLRYTNGIVMQFPQYSSVGNSTFNWTTFYYEVFP